MAGRPPPRRPSAIVLALQREAERQEATGYGLAKTTGLPLRTVQRVLAGEGSPTITTLEIVAEALGMVIEVRRR